MQSGERIVINGRHYRLETVLSTGAGSYGQVWAATDAGGRPVALKVINTLAMAQADPSLRGHWRAHLEREIAFLSQLNNEQSRHIVTLFDHGQIDGQPVLVMEQLSGNLGQWLAQRRQDNAPPLELERILDWTRQILSGLEVIHGAGFVYRDLKFSNILIDKHGALLKLADFGSLKRHDGDSTRSFIGTPATMAPEQVLPASVGPEGCEYVVDPRADYYALGLLLFTLLTDQAATAAQRRLGQLLAQHGQEGAARHREQLGGLDDAEQVLLRRSIEFWTVPVSTQPGNGSAALLTDLIIRLLARDPVDRPRNSIEIRKVLDATRVGQLMASAPQPKPATATDLPNEDIPHWDISPLTLPPNPHPRRSTTAARPRRSQRVLIGILGLAGALAWAIALRPVGDLPMPPTPEPIPISAIEKSFDKAEPLDEALSDHQPVSGFLADPTPTITSQEPLPESPPVAPVTAKPAIPQKPLAESPPVAPAIAKPQSKPTAPAEPEPQVTRRSPPAPTQVTTTPRQERISRPVVRSPQTVKAAPANSVARIEPRLPPTSLPPALPPIELKSRSQSAPPALPPIELKSRSQPAPPALPPINLVSRADPAPVAIPVRTSRPLSARQPVANTARHPAKPAQRPASRPVKPVRQTADPITRFQKDAARAAIGIRRDIKVLTRSVGVEVQRGMESVQQTLTYSNHSARVERRDHRSRRQDGPPPRRSRQ